MTYGFNNTYLKKTNKKNPQTNQKKLQNKPYILWTKLRIPSYDLLIREQVLFIRSLVLGKSWPHFINLFPQKRFPKMGE